ncbi:hypothetical protein LJB99_06295 [Deltaproteobacteria bacterium OttesenSCG-928-K17]|nr:hypothetical protein [Deltaproteobacteria bacterium OttesenSCG-928-K17]
MNTEPEIRQKYEHILAQAAQLDRQTQMELLIDLAAQLRRPLTPQNPGRPSLNELQGLFKGVWDGQDAQDYVNRERDSWIG